MKQQMLTVILNGEPKRLERPLELNQVLEAWGYHGNTFAVAVNGAFVPRSRYSHTVLSDGDKVEVVAPLSGG
jgi:sulfur carrier protein